MKNSEKEPAEIKVNNDDVVSIQTDTETVEQIGKDVIVGRKETRYEDGKNVISVFINAISVRINMPRGTVKLLMAILAVLIITALIYAADVLQNKHAADENGSGSAETEAVGEGGSSESVLSARDVVISENYSYTVPAGFAVEDPYLEGTWFSNAKAYGFYIDDGSYCVVRSYIAAKPEVDIKDEVQARLKTAQDVTDIRHEFLEMDFGSVVAYSYDIVYEDGNIEHATEYSWSDDDGVLCSLEVISGSDDLPETAQSILATVRRSENDYTNAELLKINTAYLPISSEYRCYLPDRTYRIDGPYEDEDPDDEYAYEDEYWCDFIYGDIHYALRCYVFLSANGSSLQEEVRNMIAADGSAIDKDGMIEAPFGDVFRAEYEAEDADGVLLKVTGFYWYDSYQSLCCLEICNDGEISAEAEDMLLKLVDKKPWKSQQAYPPGYVYEPDVDEAMKSEIEDAWKEYYNEKPDISDGIIKP